MDNSDDILAAARILEAGRLVAFPTETVYGLGGDAENPSAVAAIYALKNRPSDHPLIVHVAPGADIGYWSSHIPEEARKLMDVFWPGPLTLILKRASRIPPDVAGGQDSIGLRCPSHPVAQALLRVFRHGRGGIAAPSANRFGHVPLHPIAMHRVLPEHWHPIMHRIYRLHLCRRTSCCRHLSGWKTGDVRLHYCIFLHCRRNGKWL